ncbi:MAG: HD domain-containing protein [Clostridium sp.]|jgi:HD superfamily phosphodiesterase|uniref:HD domain-containing protein n=1 Tax=Clostridium sp. TaxID=1506 RepID=UPI0025BD7132|nr:HD domain-containing protein [Clostridium sp.]MCH3965409.1 HD domain-containing protein [Clostridium sp.]MCI1717359.1 HD domain-containing protein [Clostridium sp.]MCI1801699.1 HD domain-containing protein [Clostridium sp.]MCI1815550.1 HD domain-containing protein [Clostridium sp.]MCI1872453.1 HD domain-containing protein [Clostridium sp.]
MSEISSTVIKKMITYFGNDIKRINHALKVYSFSKTIGELEKLDDHQMFILELASILHDIGIKESERKYNSSAGNYQEIEGPPVARKLLEDIELNNNVVDRICFLIGNHHSYNKIDGIDLQILIESDFLVNAYEDNLKRPDINYMNHKYFKTPSGKEFLRSMYL